MNYENSLTHYGVLGMKWGRRKSKTSKGSNKKNSKKFNKSKSTLDEATRKSIIYQMYGHDEELLKKNLKRLYIHDKLRKIAKTSTVVAGAALTAGILGALGYTAWDDVVNSGQVRSVTTYNLFGKTDFDRDQVKILNKNRREIAGPLDEDFLRRYYDTGGRTTSAIRRR